ncbi:hypothetical protein CFE70_001429 [Pyrenophora teres f. teres 0-1]|uniref:Spo12 protein n=2 Tax=Pyrenophora teres f. teres TaxID=97479 RepID=E3S0U7_PYRTT|nr:hypothetical protein PTT_15733 [Pyrenophora teres f. teres 0-1]KAE8841977.1 hypothetical protein HRS9139_01274 [Pyrenophora teres f. teres]CAA9957866.1 spo12 protein [Pyrenophora teres f. maculata]KAE8850956.1 hypothetical protein PTNB85_01372 [Pyrenophora teres f. teres]KAE8851012.1 hypothetical protein HRS9122_01299 [Pyrenophora teres f. teres]
MSPNVLSARSTNAQVKPVASPDKATDKDTKSLAFHRQVLESRMQDGEHEQKFVSPSDDIMSPATQKLQAFKTKHAMKKAKPQLLFKKTNAKAFAPLKEGSGPLFAHVPNKDAQTDEAVDA